MDILRVAANSNPGSVASAIAATVRSTGEVAVQSIGAGATNQSVKAIAIAREYLLPEGIELVCYPEFTEVDINGRPTVAIVMVCMGQSQDMSTPD